MVGPESIRDKVLIDLGCGDGALAAHLADVGLKPRRYIGVDGLLAQDRAGEERGYEWADFVCSDLLTSAGALGRFGADVALISGTLNTMTEIQSRLVVTQAFEAVRDALEIVRIDESTSAIEGRSSTAWYSILANVNVGRSNRLTRFPA
jgi:hypothetical protein